MELLCGEKSQRLHRFAQMSGRDGEATLNLAAWTLLDVRLLSKVGILEGRVGFAPAVYFLIQRARGNLFPQTAMSK